MNKPNHVGRPRKWLSIEEWNSFKNNEWRHLNWKVTAMLALTTTILGFQIYILNLALKSLFGG